MADDELFALGEFVEIQSRNHQLYGAVVNVVRAYRRPSSRFGLYTRPAHGHESYVILTTAGSYYWPDVDRLLHAPRSLVYALNLRPTSPLHLGQRVAWHATQTSQLTDGTIVHALKSGRNAPIRFKKLVDHYAGPVQHQTYVVLTQYGVYHRPRLDGLICGPSNTDMNNKRT